jgi:glycosyltransferase involved in cell wall biosynthesis
MPPRYSKILEIGPIPPPRAGWGVRIEYVLRELQSRGIETAALDVGPSRKVRRPGCDDVQSAWDYAVKVLRYLRRGFRIHTHLNGDSAKAYVLVLYSTLLSRVFGRPAVLTWHGGLGARWFPSNGNRLVDTVHALIFGMSDRIICNDDQVKVHLLKYGVADAKVLSIPAFSRQYLQHTQVAPSGELATFLAARSPVMFCYAYFRPEFYLEVLVDGLQVLVKRFPQVGLVLVGSLDGSGPFREQLAAHGLSEHVYLAGDLDRDAFLSLLARTDLCIRTPVRDGVSSSVLEALALGVPVVAADNPLRPSQVVTYPYDDPRALADAAIRVLSCPKADRLPVPPEIRDTVSEEVELLIS